jgi:hypothetical protein
MSLVDNTEICSISISLLLNAHINKGTFGNTLHHTRKKFLLRKRTRAEDSATSTMMFGWPIRHKLMSRLPCLKYSLLISHSKTQPFMRLWIWRNEFLNEANYNLAKRGTCSHFLKAMFSLLRLLKDVKVKRSQGGSRTYMELMTKWNIFFLPGIESLSSRWCGSLFTHFCAFYSNTAAAFVIPLTKFNNMTVNGIVSPLFYVPVIRSLAMLVILTANQ